MIAPKITAGAAAAALTLLGACRGHHPPEATPSASRPLPERSAPLDTSRTPPLTSTRVDVAPTLDGFIDEPAWARATSIDVVTRRVMSPEPGSGVTVSLRSVHTASHIYFAASWADDTESVTHKRWTWNAAESRYAEGADREDMFALAFELEGPFTGDMLSAVDAVWDVWHWKAARTNPHGYATDKTHRYSRAQPPGKANSHPARDGSSIWIARPEDAGDSVERKRPAPTAFEGERVAQYLSGTPSGSAADVRAKGVWRDGRWTLELERKLSTGHPDDAAFAPGRAIKMAAATFDRTGDMDRASGVIELSLGAGDASAPASPGGTTARTWSFDADRGGGTPAGFSFSRTGGGPPGRWIVRAEADAPSRPNVLAQLDADDTDVRFPIAAADGVSLLNLRLSVRCKPISGRVDQACGLVFRYRDENNYYITRANPLENNIRLYTVKDGRRRQIASWSGTVTANAWHDYAVEVRGDHIQVFWDGTKVLDHHDSTFTAPGGVGVWTKADSIVYFDDLRSEPL